MRYLDRGLRFEIWRSIAIREFEICRWCQNPTKMRTVLDRFASVFSFHWCSWHRLDAAKLVKSLFWSDDASSCFWYFCRSVLNMKAYEFYESVGSIGFLASELGIFHVEIAILSFGPMSCRVSGPRKKFVNHIFRRAQRARPGTGGRASCARRAIFFWNKSENVLLGRF